MNAPAQGAKPARQPTPYEVLKSQLERTKAGLLPLMGNSRDNVDKFVTVVLQAAMDNPELLDADRKSFIAGCMRAARDGLMPDGNEAVLNIYNTKVKDKASGREFWVKLAQYLPMVGGFVKILYEHPDVLLVDAAAVYEKDHFKFVRGDHPRLEHEPTGVDDPGPVIASYMVVHLKNGQIKREVMWRRDIEKVRAASKTGTYASSPWAKWYDQQAIKSVIKRGRKQLPRSDAFMRLERNDNTASGFGDTTPAAADLAARSSVPAAIGYAPGEILEFGLPAEGEFVIVAEGEDQHQGEVQHHEDHQQGQQRQQADAKPELSAEDFAKKADGWKKAIAGGKSPNEVIATAETKNTLTQDQKLEIASWSVKPNGEGAQS